MNSDYTSFCMLQNFVLDLVYLCLPSHYIIQYPSFQVITDVVNLEEMVDCHIYEISPKLNLVNIT